MKNKKVRGQKRRLNSLLKNIDEITPAFDFENKYEHFHVPSGWWISEPKTNSRVKTEFCKKWLEKTENIINNKPDSNRFCKVVTDIVTPYFWNSQIIIFYDESYYNTFFDRKGLYQEWIPIENRSFADIRNISTELKEKGYTEVLHEEDDIVESEIWFYGEI